MPAFPQGSADGGSRAIPVPLMLAGGTGLSPVMLASRFNNMHAEQRAQLLHEHTDVQPMHDSTDEEDHSEPPPKCECI